MTLTTIEIERREVGRGHPAYVVAELSANHGQEFERAREMVRAAAAAGADAVKVQTYTPDTLTIESDKEPFRVASGGLWEGRTLYDLYEEAFTPWEWFPRLQDVAKTEGITLFSSAFDETAVAFLEEHGVPAYKVASFELVDLPLIRRIADTGKPMILSTGLATLEEISEAVGAARDAGAEQLALLWCNSAYPAPPSEMNLHTIRDLEARFGVPVGLSDHTLGHEAALAAVALGACIVEKHFTLDRETKTADAEFSLEPDEFRGMVRAVRKVEASLGAPSYEIGPEEEASRAFRRSLFVVRDMARGEALSKDNVRSIRPGYGLHPRYLPEVLGRRVTQAVERGTPLSWNLVEGGEEG